MELQIRTKALAWRSTINRRVDRLTGEEVDEVILDSIVTFDREWEGNGTVIQYMKCIFNALTTQSTGLDVECRPMLSTKRHNIESSAV